MAGLGIATTEGTNTTLTTATAETFGAGLRGELLRPGDDGYEAAQKIHNGVIDRRPAMIVRCVGVADVIAAVKLAREHRPLVAIRGGGHGVPGFAVCDSGLMIDLSRMKGIRVDPSRRTARAEGASRGVNSIMRPRPSGSRPPAASPVRPDRNIRPMG